MNSGQNMEFEQRGLGLIGDRKLCRHFYLQFYSLLDIRYFFTTRIDYAEYSKDAFIKDEKTIQTIPLKRSVVEREGLLLILCKPHMSRRSYDRLLHYQGYEWGEDYIDFLWVIQYYRKKYGTALKKKIWIFGAGNAGVRFFEKYKSSYSIGGFISNYEEEKECMGLPVIRPADILKQKNSYIVVCSVSEKEIAEQLQKIGLTGVDYGFPDTMPKKLFIAMGTCQVTNTVRILKKNGYFTALYDACFYFDTIYDACSEADSRRLKAYGDFCDVVFYNIANAETPDIRSYEPLLKKFYTKADRLFMPFYCFRGQLQQATAEENKYEMESGWIWVRGDQEVNRLIESGRGETEIIEEVSKEDYWPETEIRKRFGKELRKVSVWDRLSSFPIEPFIRENYQKIQIFIDGTHFSYHLHLYIANKIAEYLNIEPLSDSEVIEEIENERHSIMPVYPCVRHALRMEGIGAYRFWNMQSGSTEFLDFKEHIKKYIQYVVNVRSIYLESGTHFLF